MLRCTVLDDYQNVALKPTEWNRITTQVDVRSLRQHMTSTDELVEALSDTEIIVAMRERTPITATLLSRLPKLQLLVTTGMRNASIDMAAATKHDVVVCGTGNHTGPPTELTWALLLGLARHVVTENNALRQGNWQATVGSDLAGKTLGLIGLGKIGSRVAKIGQAFDMNVLAWSQHLTQERARAAGVTLTSPEELLATSDYVSVHVVLSDRTRGLLDATALRRMRPTAYLINTSRAAIVDQAALIDALETGQIAGAGLDVFDTEPLPLDHPFRRLPNVLATPHLGYVSEANYATYFREAVEDIEAFLAGSPIRVLNQRP